MFWVEKGKRNSSIPLIPSMWYTIKVIKVSFSGGNRVKSLLINPPYFIYHILLIGSINQLHKIISLKKQQGIGKWTRLSSSTWPCSKISRKFGFFVSVLNVRSVVQDIDVLCKRVPVFKRPKVDDKFSGHPYSTKWLNFVDIFSQVNAHHPKSFTNVL